MRTEQTFAELSRSAPYAPHTRDSPHLQSRSPRRTGIVSGRSPRCHAAARSSFSAPRITILSASSGSGRCSASPRPTARASGHRALRRYHRHGLGMDRLYNRDAPPWVYLNVLVPTGRICRLTHSIAGCYVSLRGATPCGGRPDG